MASDPKRLTTVMSAALIAMRDAGSLVRVAGGYWMTPGTKIVPHSGVPERSWGASTVTALVARNRAVFSDWKDTRSRNGRGRFPVKVEPVKIPIEVDL